MTEKLYDINSKTTEFEATVLSCEEHLNGYAVVLDKTAFFPEAGGQESDRGYLDNADVLDVQITDEKIFHIVNKPLAEGSIVHGNIDWNRRFDFMQQHSGEHIVSGVAHKLYGCENVGFHLSRDIVTLDFDKPLKADEIKRIEKLANEAVFKNYAIFTYYPNEETLASLQYRSKKEIEGAIRIVEIENTDICACCAPHVANTGEIGIIKLLGTESLRGGVRIEIKCGMRALEDYSIKQENIGKISAMLCVKQIESATAVEKTLNSISELKYNITNLKRQLITLKVNSFENDRNITAVFEENLEMKELQHFADALCKAYSGIRGVFSGCEGGFSFALCGESDDLDKFFSSFKSEFQVKGGGRNGMVQGTVFAEKEELNGFFENYEKE